MSCVERRFDISHSNQIMLGTVTRTAAALDRTYYLGLVNELYAHTGPLYI